MVLNHIVPGCTCSGEHCKACTTLKCVGAFRSERAKCRACENSEQKVRVKQYRMNNPELVKASQHTSYLTHSEQSKARARKRRNLHPELIKAESTNYYLDNTEQIRLTRATYYQDNAATVQARVKSYKAIHPEVRMICNANRRTYATQAGGKFTRRQWNELKAFCGFTCLCCGKQEPAIKLTADHVIPVNLGGTSDISNIQPLCFSCNARKHTKAIDYRFISGSETSNE